MIFFTVAFAFLLINFSTAVEVNYSSGDLEGIQIQILKYEDYPANPGEYFDLWIQASLGSKVNYAKFSLVESFPFSIDDRVEVSKEFTNYRGEVVLHWKVRVSEDAVEGINELKIKISTDKTGEDYVEKAFDIYLSDVQTDFDIVIQESSGTDLSVAIANIGKNTANSLIVRVPDQESYRISGTNGQMVGNLDSGDYTIVSFSVFPTGKSNVLELQLDYTDSIGKRRSVIKEVSYSSTSPVANVTRPTGNFNGNFKSFQEQERTSIFKSYWFWAAVLVVLGAGYYFYRKNSEKVRNLFHFSNKNSVSSKGTPDWVLTERKKK